MATDPPVRRGFVELTLPVDGSRFEAAMRDVVAAMERLARAGMRAVSSFRALAAQMPGTHSFRPDFDLGCTVCGLGHDEHP